MSKVYKTLKKKYVYVKEGDRSPRTNLVPDEESKMRENEDLINREGLWMGTLDVKPPKEESHKARFSFNVPKTNPRPKFHVAAKNHPIPEPGRTRLQSIPHEIAHAPLTPTKTKSKKKVKKAVLPRDKAEAERNKLVETLNDYRRHTRLLYEDVKNQIKELDTLKKDDQYDHDKLERLKRNCCRLRRRMHELKEDKAVVKGVADNIARQPTELRESNRALRQQLIALEAEVVARKEEWRFLRYYNKDGDGLAVTEFRRLKAQRKKLDLEILGFAQERKEIQATLPTISAGLSNQIAGLIKTNEHLFSAISLYDEEDIPPSMLQVYEENEDQMGACSMEPYNRLKSRPNLPAPPPEEDYSWIVETPTPPAHVSIEKAKIRRIQIEEMMKTLAPSPALRKLLDIPRASPPPAKPPKKSKKSAKKSTKNKEASGPISILNYDQDQHDENLGAAAAAAVIQDGNQVEAVVHDENANDASHDFLLPPKTYYKRSRPSTSL